jgi:hypothetical protein
MVVAVSMAEEEDSGKAARRVYGTLSLTSIQGLFIKALSMGSTQDSLSML